MPVVTLGFGGRVITCCQKSSMSTSGQLSSKFTSLIHVRILGEIISQSSCMRQFPGPLLHYPGVITSGRANTSFAIHLKAKKAQMVKYLEGILADLSHPKVQDGQHDKYRGKLQGRIVLVRLLKVLVEHEGLLLHR